MGSSVGVRPNFFKRHPSSWYPELTCQSQSCACDWSVPRPLDFSLGQRTQRPELGPKEKTTPSDALQPQRCNVPKPEPASELNCQGLQQIQGSALGSDELVFIRATPVDLSTTPIANYLTITIAMCGIDHQLVSYYITT